MLGNFSEIILRHQKIFNFKQLLQHRTNCSIIKTVTPGKCTKQEIHDHSNISNAVNFPCAILRRGGWGGGSGTLLKNSNLLNLHSKFTEKGLDPPPTPHTHTDDNHKYPSRTHPPF